jgi:hypothetical protein
MPQNLSNLMRTYFFWELTDLMISFKCAWYLKDIMFPAVLFHIRHAVSYYNFEEILQQSGVKVDYAILNAGLFAIHLPYLQTCNSTVLVTTH